MGILSSTLPEVHLRGAGDLAGAFEADDPVVAVDPGDAVSGFAPGGALGVGALVVVGPERALPQRALRQPRPEDRLDVLEGQKLGPTILPFEMLLEGGVFPHGRRVLRQGMTGAEDGAGMVNERLARRPSCDRRRDMRISLKGGTYARHS